MAHILLIEPDKILSNICVQSLQKAGHTVDVTNEAQTGVHMADERQPDLVVLELQLKKHNGIEFLYEFRSYWEWLHIPIVVHSFVQPTEFATTPVLYDALGVKKYLYKPTTSLAKFVDTVNKLIPVASI